MKKILLTLTLAFSGQLFADVAFMRCSFSDGSAQDAWVGEGNQGAFLNECTGIGGNPSYPEFEEVILG